MMGYKEYLPQKTEVYLSSEHQKTSDVRKIELARLCLENGVAKAELLTNQGVLKSLTEVNLLVDIPPQSSPLTERDKVMAYLN